MYPVAVGNAIQQLHILGLLKVKKNILFTSYSFSVMYFQLSATL